MQLAQWKKQLVNVASGVFELGVDGSQADQQELITDLYQQLSQAHAELAWVKKSA